MKIRKKCPLLLSLFLLAGCEVNFVNSSSMPNSSSSESSLESTSSDSSKESSSSTDSFLSSSEPVSSSSSESSSSSTSSSSEDERAKAYNYEPFFSNDIPNIKVTASTSDLSFATVPDRTNKWDYTTCKVSVDNCVTNYEMSSISAGIKVRGNYTANYEKKPFRIKFDKKQNLLGLNNGSKCKSWVLLADYKDSSMLRNSASFYLGKTILGSDGFYSTDYRPVHLYLNNNYWGMYLLCEQQEVNSNRINISEPEDNATNTDIGYLMEYDGYYTDEQALADGDPTFTIDYHNHGSLKTVTGSYVTPSMDGFTIKSDITNTVQTNFIASYIDNLYDLMYECIYNKKFYEFNSTNTGLVASSVTSVEELISKYVDINSLVDTYLLNEIACDPDIAWSSFYLNLDLNAATPKKLTFEACWDFDSAFGLRKGYCESGKDYYAATNSNPWLVILTNQDFFKSRVKAKWAEMTKYGVVKKTLNSLVTYSTDYVSDYKKNYDRWPNSIGYNAAVDNEVRIETRDFKTEKDAEAFFYNWLYVRLNYISSVYGDQKDVLTGLTIN